MILENNESDAFGLCRLDAESKVVFQNSKSKDVCGEKEDEICKTCLQHVDLHGQKTGIFTGKKLKIKETVCDIVYLKEAEKASVVLHVSESYQKCLAYLETCDLTAREKEIARQVIEGKTNQEIVELLCISKSTLKTHLNALYKKGPLLKEER